MQDTLLNRFVEDIMHINAGFAGMGGASAGIIGASSTNEPLINQLRNSTLAFATEHSKSKPNKTALVTMAEQIEGNLRSVQLINGISAAELDNLLERLQVLGEIPGDKRQ